MTFTCLSIRLIGRSRAQPEVDRLQQWQDSVGFQSPVFMLLCRNLHRKPNKSWFLLFMRGRSGSRNWLFCPITRDTDFHKRSGKITDLVFSNRVIDIENTGFLFSWLFVASNHDEHLLDVIQHSRGKNHIALRPRSYLIVTTWQIANHSFYLILIGQKWQSLDSYSFALVGLLQLQKITAAFKRLLFNQNNEQKWTDLLCPTNQRFNYCLKFNLALCITNYVTLCAFHFFTWNEVR